MSGLKPPGALTEFEITPEQMAKDYKATRFLMGDLPEWTLGRFFQDSERAFSKRLGELRDGFIEAERTQDWGKAVILGKQLDDLIREREEQPEG